jgi:beta-galactosidase/beta-glucuronidase
MAAAESIDLSGTWRAAVAGDEVRVAALGDDFDDTGWAPMPVPSHWRSHDAFAASDGPVLYRTRFESPAPFGPGHDEGEAAEQRRTHLVADGTFYSSDVWLDGTYLGDTEGYFFAHAFEVTELLAARA